MPDPIATDSATRSINRLVVAVWVLAALVAANIFVSILLLVVPSHLAKRLMTSFPPLSESQVFVQEDAYNGFRDWPLEKQVQSSSVIVLAKWQQEDRSLKCIISEILKQSPNVAFNFKIGDEYSSASRSIKDNTSYGSGQIMFFTGSPAIFRYSATYTGEHIIGMRDLPIGVLRDAIQNQK